MLSAICGARTSAKDLRLKSSVRARARARVRVRVRVRRREEEHGI